LSLLDSESLIGPYIEWKRCRNKLILRASRSGAPVCVFRLRVLPIGWSKKRTPILFLGCPLFWPPCMWLESCNITAGLQPVYCV